MLLNLTNISSHPIKSQIVTQILERIVASDLIPGDVLIPARKLARQQHIDKSTMLKAYNELERLGLITKVQEEIFVINEVPDGSLKLLERKTGLRGEVGTEIKRLGDELEAARKIQKDLLPDALPGDGKIRAAAFTTLSQEVGGDFYDMFEIGGGKYFILMGDASGKGLPAAMIISQIQAILKSDANHQRSISQTMQIINDYLKAYSPARNFATLFFAVFDSESGELRYSNAGHNFPMLLKYHNGIESLKTTGPALGIIAGAEFSEQKTKLEDGDLLFLFTDGLSEAVDGTGEMFGENRIEELLRTSKSLEAEKIIQKLKDEYERFVAGNSVQDDTTFMVVRILKEKE